MIKIKTEDKEFEVSPDQLQLPEGYALVTPDKVPDGFFSQEGVNSIVSERVNRAKEKARQELEEDPNFQKGVLSKYNIQLGEDGKPKGLKPTVDVDEVRQNVTKEVSERYEGQLEEFKSKLSARDKAVVSNSILSAVNGEFQDIWTESIDGENPLVVEKFANRFKVDENGKEYAVDDEGNKMFKNDGSLIRARDYFSDESKFGKYMKDKRQTGSKFRGGGKPAGDKSKKSEFSVEERSAQFEQWRGEGKKPLEEWNKLPD